MGAGLLAKLRALPRRAGERPERAASLLLPALIIVVGMSVLAWRSYVLSVRTEHGTATLAKQYAAYAADITARRIDATVRNEVQHASDDWQQVERRPPVTFEALQTWMRGRDWITAAIFLPDADPARGIYATDGAERSGGRTVTYRSDVPTFPEKSCPWSVTR